MNQGKHLTPWDFGPEYDAYLMKMEAEALAGLADGDFRPALDEAKQTIEILQDRIEKLQ